MKNIFKATLASIVLMVSCTTGTDLEVAHTNSNTLYASIETPETRTYADKDGKLLWTVDDKITAFMGNTYPRQYKYKGKTGQNYGEFNDLTPENVVISGNPLSANYAIYPYDAKTTISNSGVINYTIPATQNYAENSFGLGANVMVAVTENKDDKFLSFKNLGGYFEFSLYGEGTTVKSIEFKGNNDEDLAGAVAITATHEGNPTFEFVGAATKTLTLDCGEGVELGDKANPTTFWVVVPAITYSYGITITITDTEDRVMVKSTSKPISIERSTIQPLNAFLVETEEVTQEIPNNQIWYTANDKATLGQTPEYAHYWDNIKDHRWDSDTKKGVIEFDRDITIIGDYAFVGSGISSITLPNSVVKINEGAFAGCRFTEFCIPESVTEIGGNAFRTCPYLKDITIPNNVTNIGEYAFSGCYELTEVNIGNKITIIKEGTFSQCSSLSDIVIPTSVTSIGDSAFYSCSSLKNINLPNSVTSIGHGVFSKSGLEEFTFPTSLKTIGWHAFANCTNLKKVISNISGSIDIEQDINSYEDSGLGLNYLERVEGCNASRDNLCLIIDGVIYAFAGRNLESYTFPNEATSIGPEAFTRSSLKTIDLHSGMSVCDQAFAYCNKIEEVNIPKGVTVTGDMAFAGCTGTLNIDIEDIYGGDEDHSGPFEKSYFDMIVLGPNVKNISPLAFGQYFILYSQSTTPPVCHKDSFYPFKIYVPTNSVDTYKTADGWKEYADIIEPYNF